MAKPKSKTNMKNMGTKCIAINKIYYLHNLALLCNNSKMIKHYNREIIDIAHKSQLRLDPSMKQVICKMCCDWLYSRLEGNELHCNCRCGYLKIYPLSNKTRYTDMLDIKELPM
eukprot:NODE_581_length_6441_cov_0.484390.p6 type:complete len:114 gc:universal NODE_581_length_6441_cov_0.484390:5877-6218(+)